jgi:hypothetical protein
VVRKRQDMMDFEMLGVPQKTLSSDAAKEDVYSDWQEELPAGAPSLCQQWQHPH